MLSFHIFVKHAVDPWLFKRVQFDLLYLVQFEYVIPEVYAFYEDNDYKTLHGEASPNYMEGVWYMYSYCMSK